MPLTTCLAGVDLNRCSPAHDGTDEEDDVLTHIPESGTVQGALRVLSARPPLEREDRANEGPVLP